MIRIENNLAEMVTMWPPTKIAKSKYMAARWGLPWPIVVTITSETSGQKWKQFGRNGHWITNKIADPSKIIWLPVGLANCGFRNCYSELETVIGWPSTTIAKTTLMGQKKWPPESGQCPNVPKYDTRDVKHDLQGPWLIAVKVTSSETAAQNSNWFHRNGHWMTV